MVSFTRFILLLALAAVAPEARGEVLPSLVVRAGDVPSGSDWTTQEVSVQDLNRKGQVLILGLGPRPHPVLPPVSAVLVRVAKTGRLEPIVLDGARAPGTPAGAVFGRAYSGLLNDAGEVLFNAELALDSGGVDESNQHGLWGPDAAGGVRLIARQGQALPGSGGLALCSASPLRLLADGTALFVGASRADCQADGPRQLMVVVANTAGDLEGLVRLPGPAPGLGQGVELAESDLAFAIAANELGDVALRARLEPDAGADVALWGPNSEGALAILAREGSAAPGVAGGLFGGDHSRFAVVFDRPVVDGERQVAFLASLAHGPGGVDESNDTGLWVGDPDSGLTLVLREGGAVPGAPEDVVMGDLGESFGVATGANGGLALFGRLVVGPGAVTEDDDGVILGPDGQGGVTLWLREGSDVGLPDGISIVSLEPGDARDRPSVNDAAEVFFSASVTVPDYADPRDATLFATQPFSAQLLYAGTSYLEFTNGESIAAVRASRVANDGARRVAHEIRHTDIRGVGPRDIIAFFGIPTALDGQVVGTEGTERVVIGGDRCEDEVDVEVAFEPDENYVMDADGPPITGDYLQEGDRGRTIRFQPRGRSSRDLKRRIKDMIRACLGVERVGIDLDSIKLRGQLDKELEQLKLKSKVRFSGRAGGDPIDGSFVRKTRGEVELIAP